MAHMASLAELDFDLTGIDRPDRLQLASLGWREVERREVRGERVASSSAYKVTHT